jgi:hypothetical protein
MPTITDDRRQNMHPSAENVLKQFQNVQLSEDQATTVNGIRNQFQLLADYVAKSIDGPDVVVALRSLMAAKDDTVRAAINQMGGFDA